MTWFPASLGVAFLAASEAALLKRFFGHLPPLQMAAMPLAYVWPAYLALWLFLGAPLPGPEFWRTAVLLMPFDAAGFLLSCTAINLAPLSLTMPYMAFTPAIVIGTGYLMLGEKVKLTGLAGILLVVAGSYVLNIRHFRQDDLLAPLKAIVRERGSRYMLVTSVIYALTSVLGKKLVLLAGPLHSAVVYWTFSIPVTLALLALAGRLRLAPFAERPRRAAAVAAVMAGHLLLHMYAVGLTKTAYMIAVKRLSGFFGVLYGGLLFGERGLAPLIAGSLLMALGAAVLAVAG